MKTKHRQHMNLVCFFGCADLRAETDDPAVTIV